MKSSSESVALYRAALGTTVEEPARVEAQWQVRELRVDFWHNHFNVNIDTDNTIRSSGQKVS